jgi:hypothetical protein
LLTLPQPRSIIPPPVTRSPSPNTCHAPLPFAAPEGFQVLRDEAADGVRTLVLRATPAAWERFQADGAEVSPLSLEDIFIALVGTPAVAI